MNVLQRILYAVRSPTLRRARYSSRYGAIVAGNYAGGERGGWSGVQSNRNEDAANKDYAHSFGDVVQRAQDLDVNNPDIGGFHRTRVAQCLGAGVTFEHAPHHEELDLTTDQAASIATRINRLRQIHSRTGGFDSTGQGFTEGKQQERALLTAFINGACLIHRTWRPENPVVPLSLELIPGVRISTPYRLAGSPTTSYGIEYADTHRTRVVGYWVRRVSMTIGDSFVPDYEWDFLPIEDCVLLSLTEQAGIDRALPLATRVTRMARNRGEFIEASVESARAQARHYGVNEAAPGGNPYDVADDDRAELFRRPPQHIGDGVFMLYTNPGEKVSWSSAKLPDPDFTGFMDKTDERMARGLNASLSRFTRRVNSSWAGGRLEDQQDDPIVAQLRESFIAAWQRVNEWFLEACWLSDQVELPGYGSGTRHLWTEFDATFPAKVHINPTDTQTAREKGLMQRTMTPQRACKEDALSLRHNLEEWAQAYVLQDEVEKKYKLASGRLDILFSGKSITSAAGADLAPPPPDPEAQPAGDDQNKKPDQGGEADHA